MLYQSENFVVVRVDVPAEDGAPARGGYEIVDRLARRDVWLDGVLADSFRRGVEELVERAPEPEAFDDFIAGWAQLSRHPLALH